MALPPNPLAELITKASASVTAAATELKSTGTSLLNSAQSAMGGLGADISKAGIDAKVASLGAGIGSNLNGLTAGVGGALSSAQGALGQLNGIGGGALSSITGGAQSLVSNAQGALGAAAGIAGSVSNIAAGGANVINKLTGGFASAGGLGSGLMDIARNVSAAAGQINNLLSLFRGKNIPSGADLFQQTGAQVKLSPVAANDWRVRLNCDFNTLFGSGTFSRLVATNGVVWPYLPNISISTKANYTQVDPVHNNFPFQSYKNSQVEDITISGEFSAETETDAAYWIAATTFFRTATKMFYGGGANAGNPPVICHLTGYGSMVFNNVPVVIKSFTVDLKDDVNYVQCNAYGTPTWVPIMSTISVTVAPIYNRERLRRFSLENFAKGKEIGMI